MPQVAKKGQPTAWEKKFAEAWVANGQNGQAAAEAAGTVAKSARIRASEALKRPRVISYIGGLTHEALARAESERAGAVASLQECLEFMTMVQRARIGDFINDDGDPMPDQIKGAPAGLIRRYQRTTTTSDEGQVTERTVIEMESALSAAEKLLGYHVRMAERQDGPKDTLGQWAQAIGDLAELQRNPLALKTLMRRWLAGDVIDVPAVRVEP